MILQYFLFLRYDHDFFIFMMILHSFFDFQSCIARQPFGIFEWQNIPAPFRSKCYMSSKFQLPGTSGYRDIFGQRTEELAIILGCPINSGHFQLMYVYYKYIQKNKMVKSFYSSK